MISRRLVGKVLLAGGAAAAAVVALRTQSRTRTAEETYPPLGEFVEVGGRRVHYYQQGSGPDLVLLHGAGGNLREFAFDLMGQLTDRYRVTAFDRPGLGYSDVVPQLSGGAWSDDGASPAQQADQLRAACALIGVEHPIVAGHSFGGIVALAWALAGLDEDHPANARALASFGGVSMPWTTKLDAYYRINGTTLGGAVIAPVISSVATQNMIKDRIAAIFEPQPVPEGYAGFVGAELNLRPATFRHNIRQVNTLLPHVQEMEPRYSALTLPIEMVHGDADTTVPLNVHSAPFTERYGTAALTVLDGVGHMPHHADPDACVAAIDRAAARAREGES